METIIGYQFEPEKPNHDSSSDDGWETYDDENPNEDEELVAEVISMSGLEQDVDTWCKCGQCKPMPTETESVCCRGLEATSYFDLNGIQFSKQIIKTY